MFRDAGFVPVLREASIELGPGQMAVIGFGQYTTTEHDLGVQDDVVIPRRIEPAPAAFRSVGANAIEATVIAPAAGDLRMFFEQRAADGTVFKGKTAGTIEAWQENRKLPVDAAIKGDVGFGGVSWSAAEIRRKDFVGDSPLTLSYSSEVDTPIALNGRVYIVEY